MNLFQKKIKNIKHKVEKQEEKEHASYFDVADYLAVKYINNKYGFEIGYFKSYRHLLLVLELAPILVNRANIETRFYNAEFEVYNVGKFLKEIEEKVVEKKREILNIWINKKVDKELELLKNPKKLKVLAELKSNLLKDINFFFGTFNIRKVKQVKKFINLK